MKKMFIAYFIIFNISLFSQSQSNVTWSRVVNWEKNTIDINIKSKLDNRDKTLVATRRKAQNWIEDNITDIFFKNILDMNINSLENVSEIINKNPEIYYKLDRLGESLEATSNILSTNLEYLDTQYSFPIYPNFVSIFYTQTQHLQIRKKLDHREYGNFTGLIIYIPEELPLYQKGYNGTLEKVLFPRIFNQDLDIILDFTMVEPEYMTNWGMVIYGESFDENLYQNRIGINPLRIIGKSIFGKNNSDIIISNKDADKLIGTEDNLKIISQGRVLIIN